MKSTKSALLGLLVLIGMMGLTSCNENYSNGERIGVVTQFSQTGQFYKSWEGHLNVTQTGMNSSVPFDFSIDNDNEDTAVINTLKAAADSGWKVKLVYHETFGKNLFGNRGETNHFITKVEVLSKNFATPFATPAAASSPIGSKDNPMYIVITKEVKKDTTLLLVPVHAMIP